MGDPKLDDLKTQVMWAQIPLLGVPLSLYFYLILMYPDVENIQLYAGLGAVAASQAVILMIALYKYWDDFKAVLNGTGDVPYDEALIGKENPFEKLDRKSRDKSKLE